MEEPDVLQHLLEVEKQAAELVLDAQKKADETTSSADAELRIRADERRTTRLAELEAAYAQGLQEIRNEYDRVLREYAATLEARQSDTESFRRLALSMLFPER